MEVRAVDDDYRGGWFLAKVLQVQKPTATAVLFLPFCPVLSVDQLETQKRVCCKLRVCDAWLRCEMPSGAAAGAVGAEHAKFDIAFYKRENGRAHVSLRPPPPPPSSGRDG